MARADVVGELIQATRVHDLGDEALEGARQRVREALRQIRRRVADDQLADFLGNIEANAFKPDFRVSELKREFKVTKKTLREFFRATGHSPAALVDELKTEEAFRLVLETDLKIWQIAEFAGLSHAYFTTKFRQRFGGKPTQVRHERRLEATEAPTSADPEVAAEAPGSATEAASSANAEAPPPVLIELVPAPADTAQQAAAVLWRLLAEQPFEEQRARLRTCRFHTREFIDLLGQQYQIVSRANRGRGIEVAELAVLSVETSAEALGDAAHELRALAYAWLGNAKRLALDYYGAEKALNKAQELWEQPAERRDRRAVAEILGLKGRLRFCQRKFGESLDLLNQAIKESRLGGASRLLAQCLLLRAGLIEYARMPLCTLPDLQQALSVLEALDEPRLRLGAHMILAYSYTAAAEPNQALNHVAKAWALWEQLTEPERDPVLPHQLRWNEGLARHRLGELASAESLYKESRAAFIELEETEHAAVVALDLARLDCEQGRTSEVLRLTSEVFPVLERLKIPEATEALRLLRGSLEKSMVSTDTLNMVRSTLVAIQQARLPCTAWGP